MGPPRDQALVDLAHDARNFLLGRPRPQPEEPLSKFLRGVRASANRGEFDAALADADRLTQAAIGVRRDVAMRRGARGVVARAMGEAQRASGRADLSATERDWLERALETDPRWLPWIPKGDEPPAPAGNVVLNLAWHSLPHVQDEHAARVQQIALGQRAAGLRPLVLTPPGFPRMIGIQDAPLVDDVDGVSYLRLDPGPGYGTAQPPGQYLSDYAWLAATIAQRERPRLVHAFGLEQGYRIGLVGLALRSYLRVPLVYEVGPQVDDVSTLQADQTSEAESARADGSTYDEPERLAAAELRCLREADAVIAPSGAIRDAIVRRGVERTNVLVIPNAVQIDGTGANGEGPVSALDTVSGPERVTGPRPESGQRYRRLYELLVNRAPAEAAAAVTAASQR